jgi:hypothetical protein
MMSALSVSLLGADGTNRFASELWRRPGEVSSLAHSRVAAPPSGRDGGSSWQAIAYPYTNDDRLTQGVVWDSVNDRIYMYGGSPDGNIGTDLSQMDRYDPSSDEWTSVAPMATARGWIKGVYCNGRIYAISGFNNAGAEEPSVEEYSIATNSWRYRASIPTPEIAYSAVVYHDSIIIVMGGTPDSAANPDTRVQIFNPATNTWLPGTSMNTGLDMFDACLVGDTIYIPGGGGQGSDTMFWGAINPANPTQIKWGKYAQTIAGGARFCDPCVALNGKVYYCNGAHGFIYDPIKATYDTLTDMPVTCYRCCFWCSDDARGTIYKMAGDDNGDWNPPNNTYYKIQCAMKHDCGCTAILVPGTDVDSGFTLVPTVRISNLGNSPETNIPVIIRMDNGSWYRDSTMLPGLTSMHDTIVAFKPVMLTWRGYHTCACSTELAGDLEPSNDKTTMIFKIEMRDVGCIAITSPSGMIDSGTTLIPIGVVYNYGTAPAGFRTMMRIWDPAHPGIPGYLDEESTYLEANAYSNVTFAAWTVMPRGLLTAKCSTMYQYELHHEDDARGGTVLVRVIDAGASSIIWPTGTLVPKGSNVPKGTVTNYGDLTEDVPATFNVFNDSGVLVYSSTVTQTLTPGQTAPYFFTTWNAPPESNYVGQLVTSLTGDVNPANNQISDTFTVFPGTRDVGVDEMLSPTNPQDTIDFAPSVDVKNYGSVSESFYCYMQIVYLGNDRVAYYDSVPVAGIGPGASRHYTFPMWTGHKVQGQYSATAWTLMTGDQNPSDDTCILDFNMQGMISLAWTAEASVPPGPEDKQIKDGAQLTFFDRGGNPDSTFIFCLKGNNTLEYYKYAIPTNNWGPAETIPLVSQSTGIARRVKTGSVLATGPDGMIYAAKGNNSLEWWQYNEPADTNGGTPWNEKARIPFGAHTLSEGADAVGIEDSNNGYIYLLKGSNTREFYRYDCTNNVWQTLKSAPLGFTGKNYKDGSNLAYDPNRNLIYCLKGQYNEFFVYSVAADSWLSELPSLPTLGCSGKPKYAKSGATLECMNGSVFCLKGDNTLEFFQYNESTGVWTWNANQQYPIGGGRSVDLGGALIWGAVQGAAYGALFSTKGNGTTEFYTYGHISSLTLTPSHRVDAVENSRTTPTTDRLTVAPNPFTGSTRISYSVTKAGPVRILLYDATGKLVTTVAEGYCNAGSSFSTCLDASRLARGVYLLKFNSEGYSATRKLLLVSRN